MSTAVATPPALLAELAGHRFPIFLTPGLEPRATLDAGATSARVLVCSLPKSGTYLIGGLLSRLGMGDPHLHVNLHGLTDYRFADRTQALRRPRELEVRLPLATSLQVIGPGQFVVGHLPCDAEVRGLTADFRIIAATRDLRDALLSMMRFLLDTGRTSLGPADARWRTIEERPRRFQAFLETEGLMLLRTFEGMTGWLEVPGVRSVRFETLAGDRGRGAQVQAVVDLAAHAGIVIPTGEAEAALDATLGANTLTWSGGRSRRDEFWDYAVAATFESIGGVEANRRFGYE